MAQKHKGYIPQTRRPAHERPIPRAAEILTPQEVMAKLVEKFELPRIAAGEEPQTVLGLCLDGAKQTAELYAEKPLDRDKLWALLPDLVQELRIVIARLAKDGFDVANDHHAIPTQTAMQYLIDLGESVYGVSEADLRGDIGAVTGKVTSEMATHDYRENLEVGLTSQILLSHAMSRGLAKKVGGTHFDDYTLENLLHTNTRVHNRRLTENPNEVRRETTRDLHYLLSDEVTEMLAYYQGDDENTTTEQPTPVEAQLPHQQLDFEVLPRGSDSREYTEAIIRRLSETERSYVDLDRIGVLEEIREIWGVDKCYFAHGKKTGKQMQIAGAEDTPEVSATDNTSESTTGEYPTSNMVDEDYVVLVMSDLDPRGRVVGEHALAISPIARKHGAYLTRYDVSAGEWREVLPLPKEEAKDVGARGLKFMPAAGHAPYDLMREKICALLNCPPDDFPKVLRMRGDGTYRTQNSPRALGQLASRLLA